MGREIHSEHANRSGRRRDQSQQHLNGGGLAGAVGTEKPEDLARLDRKGNAIDRREITEPLFQMTHLEDRNGHTRRIFLQKDKKLLILSGRWQVSHLRSNTFP